MSPSTNGQVLLDLAAQPPPKRQRSSFRDGNSTKANVDPSPSPETAASRKQTQLRAEYSDIDEDEVAPEDEDDDSVSVYRESLSPPPPPPPPPPPRSMHASVAEDTPTSTKPPGNKRGRKPAPAASRSAREQARKSNHSRIEKRRREKINDALATLRQIIPVDIAQIVAAQGSIADGAVEDDIEGSASILPSPALSAQGSAGQKKGSEKEFKLEVLERTVIFVKYLIDRVESLEDQLENVGDTLLHKCSLYLVLTCQHIENQQHRILLGPKEQY